jgi:hypothetical protein
MEGISEIHTRARRTNRIAKGQFSEIQRAEPSALMASQILQPSVRL